MHDKSMIGQWVDNVRCLAAAIDVSTGHSSCVPIAVTDISGRIRWRDI